MASEIHLVIDLGESAKVGVKLALFVMLEAGARDYIEYTITAIAKSRRVSATLSLYVVDIFRIDLRADICWRCWFGYGNAVDCPRDLITAADVKLIAPGTKSMIVLKLFDRSAPGVV